VSERVPHVPLIVWQIVLALAAAAIGGVAAVLPELRDANGLTNGTVGVIAAAGFLAAFVGQGLLAPLADQWQRRPIILIGLIVAVLGLVGMALGSTGWQLILSRLAIGGGTGVVIPTIRAAVALSDPDHVAENQGKLVVGEMVGFIVGPAATAIAADALGVDRAFLMLAGLLAVFLPLVLRVPHTPVESVAVERETRSQVLKRPALRGVMVMVGGYALGLGAFEAVLPLQLADEGVSTAGIGLFLTIFVIPIALSSVLGGRVADRVGPLRVATIGMLAGSILAMGIGIMPSIWWIAALLVLAGVSDGFGFTASLALASASVAQDRQATALGVVGASEVLFAGLGALPAVWLFDTQGPGVAWIVMGAAMTVLVAVGAMMCARATTAHDSPRLTPAA